VTSVGIVAKFAAIIIVLGRVLVVVEELKRYRVALAG
jgi:hypothetical protein